jgi:hypothetical protein
VDVPDCGLGTAKRGIESGIVQPVSMHFVKTEGDIEGGGAGLIMLPAQVIE